MKFLLFLLLVNLTYGYELAVIQAATWIKKHEGIRLDVYPDPLSKGLPYTVGYGSTKKLDGTPFKMGERITREYAEKLLMHHLTRVYGYELKRSIPYYNEMNHIQQAVLITFSYNLGAKFYGKDKFQTISRVLRKKQWHLVDEALQLYYNPRSVCAVGLLKRRKNEAMYWNYGLGCLQRNKYVVYK